MAALILTPYQTTGPFYGSALISADLAHAGGDGPFITVTGQILDGAGPFSYPTGMIELWDEAQFVRAQTDDNGRYHVTIRDPAAHANGKPANHAVYLSVVVYGPGLLRPLLTRLYFPSQERALASDPVLGCVPVHRQATLIGTQVSDTELRFDIRTQGRDETVFFEL